MVRQRCLVQPPSSDLNEQKLGDLIMPLLVQKGIPIGAAMQQAKQSLAVG